MKHPTQKPGYQFPDKASPHIDQIDFKNADGVVAHTIKLPERLYRQFHVDQLREKCDAAVERSKFWHDRWHDSIEGQENEKLRARNERLTAALTAIFSAPTIAHDKTALLIWIDSIKRHAKEALAGEGEET
jgi:hypothetical protein